jgi:hypothetical protein
VTRQVRYNVADQSIWWWVERWIFLEEGIAMAMCRSWGKGNDIVSHTRMRHVDAEFVVTQAIHPVQDFEVIDM